MMKIWENNGTDEIGLVTPTPELPHTVIPDDLLVQYTNYSWCLYYLFWQNLTLEVSEFGLWPSDHKIKLVHASCYQISP